MGKTTVSIETEMKDKLGVYKDDEDMTWDEFFEEIVLPGVKLMVEEDDTQEGEEETEGESDEEVAENTEADAGLEQIESELSELSTKIERLHADVETVPNQTADEVADILRGY